MLKRRWATLAPVGSECVRNAKYPDRATIAPVPINRHSRQSLGGTGPSADRRHGDIRSSVLFCVGAAVNASLPRAVELYSNPMRVAVFRVVGHRLPTV